MKYTVGQKLYYVPSASRHGIAQYVEITKIGRKYLYANYMKIDAETLCAVDWPYGKCWFSEEDYLKDCEIAQAWRQFFVKVQRMYTKPDGITLEEVTELRKLCRISDDV